MNHFWQTKWFITQHHIYFCESVSNEMRWDLGHIQTENLPSITPQKPPSRERWNADTRARRGLFGMLTILFLEVFLWLCAWVNKTDSGEQTRIRAPSGIYRDLGIFIYGKSTCINMQRFKFLPALAILHQDIGCKSHHNCNVTSNLAATTRLFAKRNGDWFSMLMGYVNLQLRLSTKMLLMSFSLSKLAEGGCNRTFLITLRWLPAFHYPMTVPKYYAVTSEVATIEYMRSSGLPVRILTRLG